MPYRTYAEYLRHPRYRAVRLEAMEKANWRCQKCGARATEVQHLRYPPWGQSNHRKTAYRSVTIAVCRIEGKQK